MAAQEETEPASVTRARDRLDREAEAVRSEQLERALSRLRANGDLSDEQRAAVEQLSERLVDGLLAASRERLRMSPGDAEVARILMEMFD